MRFLSLGSFLGAIGVFFLPWLDVRCEKGTEKFSLYTQSGYEIAEGRWSEAADLKKMKEEIGAKMPAAPGGPVIQPAPNAPFGDDKPPPPAPTMWAYVAALGLGALLSLIPGNAWRAGAVVCALGAGGVLGYQVYEEFPAQKEVRGKFEEFNKMVGGMQNMPGGGPPKMTVQLLPMFYLACALTVAPILWAIIDALNAPKPRAAAAPDDFDSSNPFPDQR